MTPEFATQILREALMTAFWLSLPLLLVGFVIGVAVSLVQILTSIQDSAFSALPRLVGMLLVFLVALPWMMKYLSNYTRLTFGDLSRYAR